MYTHHEPLKVTDGMVLCKRTAELVRNGARRGKTQAAIVGRPGEHVLDLVTREPAGVLQLPLVHRDCGIRCFRDAAQHERVRPGPGEVRVGSRWDVSARVKAQGKHSASEEKKTTMWTATTQCGGAFEIKRTLAFGSSRK